MLSAGECEGLREDLRGRLAADNKYTPTCTDVVAADDDEGAIVAVPSGGGRTQSANAGITVHGIRFKCQMIEQTASASHCLVSYIVVIECPEWFRLFPPTFLTASPDSQFANIRATDKAQE